MSTNRSAFLLLLLGVVFGSCSDAPSASRVRVRNAWDGLADVRISSGATAFDVSGIPARSLTEYRELPPGECVATAFIEGWNRGSDDGPTLRFAAAAGRSYTIVLPETDPPIVVMESTE
jgi:hypothetical protein